MNYNECYKVAKKLFLGAVVKKEEMEQYVNEARDILSVIPDDFEGKKELEEKLNLL